MISNVVVGQDADVPNTQDVGLMYAGALPTMTSPQADPTVSLTRHRPDGDLVP
jgi:hypothetical protein